MPRLPSDVGNTQQRRPCSVNRIAEGAGRCQLPDCLVEEFSLRRAGSLVTMSDPARLMDWPEAYAAPVLQEEACFNA